MTTCGTSEALSINASTPGTSVGVHSWHYHVVHNFASYAHDCRENSPFSECVTFQSSEVAKIPYLCPHSSGRHQRTPPGRTRRRHIPELRPPLRTGLKLSHWSCWCFVLDSNCSWYPAFPQRSPDTWAPCRWTFTRGPRLQSLHTQPSREVSKRRFSLGSFTTLRLIL